MPPKKNAQTKKSFLKRTAKAAAYVFLAVCFLLFGLNLAMQYLLPAEKVKNKITQTIADATKMDVSITDIRASLRGLFLSGLIVGDENGPLLTVEEFRLSLSPLQLLRGRIFVTGIFINGLAVLVVRAQDGSFNFDKMLAPNPSAGPQEEESAGEQPKIPPVIFVKRLQITDSVLSYIDRAENVNARIERLFVDIDDFSLNKSFTASSNSRIWVQMDNKEMISDMPFGFVAQPNLAGLDLDKAAVEIKNIILRRLGSDLIISGNITNFNNPDINLEVNVQKLTPAAFAPLALLDFEIPLIKIAAKINLDLVADTAHLSNIDLDFLASKINIKGFFDYGAPKPKFNLNIAAALGLEGFNPAIAMLKEYKPAGALTAQAALTQDDVKGNIVIAGAGAHLPQAGELSGLEVNVEAASIKDIKITQLQGKLNGHAFMGGASYLDKGSATDVSVFFKADTLFAKTDKTLQSAESAQPEEEQPAAESAQPAHWPLPPLNIKADVDIKNLDTHFLSGANILFKADMEGVTPQLNETHGVLSLTAQKGQIKDLYSLTNANSVTKVLFVSLTVISKVINTLDVLSVLKAIGGAAAGAVKKKTPAELEADENAPKTLSGVLDYDTFNTNLDFNEGISDIKEINFASDKLSFKVTGNINFNNRKLNMTVNAAPGNVSKDGIMPLAIKIGGTVEEPKGSLSMLSSTAALVSQSLLNNPASNLVKSLGGLLGIGKKKDKTAPDEYVPFEPALQPAD